MDELRITPYKLAERFIGIKEIDGTIDNPLILSMLQLDNSWPNHDEVPWCSAFVNYIAWLLGLSRSRDLRAVSWLDVGEGLDYWPPKKGFDIVILKNHVGFFSEIIDNKINILGGNQSDSVNIVSFDLDQVVALRQLVEV